MKKSLKEAKIWKTKAKALEGQGKYKEAIKCYTKALKIDPKDGRSWKNKAKALKHQGRYIEAIKCYTEALKIEPKDGKTWKEKGKSLQARGKYIEAVKCYNKALDLDPLDIQALKMKEVQQALQNRQRYPYQQLIQNYRNQRVDTPFYIFLLFHQGVQQAHLTLFLHHQ